jgi:hypothetical protein
MLDTLPRFAPQEIALATNDLKGQSLKGRSYILPPKVRYGKKFAGKPTVGWVSMREIKRCLEDSRRFSAITHLMNAKLGRTSLQSWHRWP